MGSGIDSMEDGRLRLVGAGARSAGRVFGVDGSESSAPHEVRRAQSGQGPAQGGEGDVGLMHGQRP